MENPKTPETLEPQSQDDKTLQEPSGSSEFYSLDNDSGGVASGLEVHPLGEGEVVGSVMDSGEVDTCKSEPTKEVDDVQVEKMHLGNNAASCVLRSCSMNGSANECQNVAFDSQLEKEFVELGCDASDKNLSEEIVTKAENKNVAFDSQVEKEFVELGCDASDKNLSEEIVTNVENKNVAFDSQVEKKFVELGCDASNRNFSEEIVTNAENKNVAFDSQVEKEFVELGCDASDKNLSEEIVTNAENKNVAFDSQLEKEFVELGCDASDKNLSEEIVTNAENKNAAFDSQLEKEFVELGCDASDKILSEEIGTNAENNEVDGKIQFSGDNLSLYIDMSGVQLENSNEVDGGKSMIITEKAGMESNIQEHDFGVSDLVWVKSNKQMWWPGKIRVPPNKAKSAVEKNDVRELVVWHIGKPNVSRCLPSQLEPFLYNFNQKAEQTEDISFLRAVTRAVSEFGKCMKLEMTCSCLFEGSQQLDDNGAREGITNVRSGSGKLGKFSVVHFEPARFLLNLKDLACNLSVPGMLEFSFTQNLLSAFYSSVGHKQVAMHHLCDIINDPENAEEKILLRNLALKSHKRKRKDPEFESHDDATLNSLRPTESKVSINGSGKGGTDVDKGKSSGLRQRKKSKYLSYPFVSYEKNSLFKDTEDNEVAKASRGVEGTNINADQFAASSPVLKSNAKRFQELRLNKFISDDSNAALMNAPLFNLLSGLRSTAMDCLYLNKTEDSDLMELFFTKFRICKYHDESMDETHCQKTISQKDGADDEGDPSGEDPADIGKLSPVTNPKQKPMKRKKNLKTKKSKPKSLLVVSEADVNISVNNLSEDNVHQMIPGTLNEKPAPTDSQAKQAAGATEHLPTEQGASIADLISNGLTQTEQVASIADLISNGATLTEQVASTADLISNGATQTEQVASTAGLISNGATQTEQVASTAGLISNGATQTEQVASIADLISNGATQTEQVASIADLIFNAATQAEQVASIADLIPDGGTQTEQVVTTADLISDGATQTEQVASVSDLISNGATQTEQVASIADVISNGVIQTEQVASIAGAKHELHDGNRDVLNSSSFMMNFQVTGGYSVSSTMNANNKGETVLLSNQIPIKTAQPVSNEKPATGDIGLLSGESKPSQKRKRRTKIEMEEWRKKMFEAGIPDLNRINSQARMPGNDLADTNSASLQGTPKRKRKRKQEPSGIINLLLTFAPGVPVPSKDFIIEALSKVVSVNAQETQVSQESSNAQVVLMENANGSEAVQFLEKDNPFGESLISYRLQPQLSVKTVSPEKTAAYKPSGSTSTSRPGETSPSLDVIRQNLVMMTTMLEKSGKNLSPDMRGKLETEIKGLLTKVSSMPSS